MGNKNSSQFGKETTAKQVVDLLGQDLAGKTAIVTGGNQGIGLETCKALASGGARVILCSRSVEAGLKAIDSEIKQPGEGKYVVSDENAARVIVKQLDLNSLKIVKKFCDDINATEERIDFLIMNAGIMAVPKLEFTVDGFEKQIGVNHFGHFHLFQNLEEKMKAQDFPSRVVVLSSSAHGWGTIDLADLHFKDGRSYSPYGAYGQSKLANIFFTKELARRTKGTKITPVCLHPGVIQTNLFTNVPVPDFLMSAASAIGIGFDKSIPQGASTTLYGCLAPELSKDENRGAYLDDCKISSPSTSEGVDKDGTKSAEFWKLTEKQIAAVNYAKE